MNRRKLNAFCVLSFTILIMLSSCSDPPSGLPDVYAVAQSAVKDQLISPTSAIFPEYEKSFVNYDRSVLENLGEGVELEYRVYIVNAYVDSPNAFGTVVRTNFTAEVYVYVDDYVSPEFGEQGIHKNIEDHYYTYILW